MGQRGHAPIKTYVAPPFTSGSAKMLHFEVKNAKFHIALDFPVFSRRPGPQFEIASDAAIYVMFSG